MSVTGVILSCATLSSTFPKPISHELERDALLNSVDDLFNADITLVRLDGKPDIGKTTVLRQFTIRHLDHALSVFLRSDSWFLQHQALFYTDLATQMHWALRREEPPDTLAADETTIRSLSFDLQKSAKKSNSLVYFVIDGADTVSSSEGHFISSMLRVLPTEYSQFRFLCSGNATWIPSKDIPLAARKTLIVPGFSLLECSAYFEGLNLERSQIDEIYRNCGRGTPGYLASARRSLEGGLSTAALLDRLPDHLQEAFAVEFGSAPLQSDLCKSALAILSHDTNPHSINQLAGILGVESPQIRQPLSCCTFLDIPVGDELSVAFISESFRRFVADKLNDLASATWNRLADYYSQDETASRVDLLPSYLQRAGRPKEIIKVMTPGVFMRMAEHSDSYVPLQRRGELGLQTALSLKRHADAFRFRIQNAVAMDISQFAFARSEVLARLVLDDYPTALSIAQSAALKFQRLQLMAAIAKAQKKGGLTPEVTLVQALGALVQQVQPAEFGDALVEVASDLMFVDARLALELISKVTPNSADSKSIDLALLRIAALTAAENVGADAGMSAAVEEIQSRITNPTARQTAKTVSLLVVDLKPDEILRQARGLNSAGEQLFLLRQWCAHCRQPNKAGEVIDYAVHLAIRTTEYLPTATDFREFSEPLPFLEETDMLGRLITAFDIQKEAARNAGPVQDYIQWQLLLAKAEGKLSAFRAGQRLQEICYEVTMLPESDVKTVCLSLIVAALPQIDPTAAFEDTPSMRRFAEEEFSASYKAILANTADHYRISRRLVESLAVARPDLALQVIDHLNYQSRQDQARVDMVQRILEKSSHQPPLAILLGLLGQWGDRELEDEAVRLIVRGISNIDDSEWLVAEWAQIEQCIMRGILISNPYTRCNILGRSIGVFNKATKRDSLLYGQILSEIDAAWNSIGDPETKLRAGYGVARRLADYEREGALDFLRKADSERSRFTNLSNSAFARCLRLLLRAFSGLLPQRLEDGRDLERIASLVERVPSAMARVFLWSDIALRGARLGRIDFAREIAGKRMKPLLETLKQTCKWEWIRSLTMAAPALYCLSAVNTLEYLRELPVVSKDEAFDSILFYLLTGIHPGEPYKGGEVKGYNVDYEKCVEILKVAEHVDSDYVVYRFIEGVAESAKWKHNRFPHTQEQRNDLARMIRELAAKKFPNPRCIQHDGFAILAEAQAMRLLRERSVDWSPLIRRATNLANVSDRAFVLMHLGAVLHTGAVEMKKDLYAKAKETIQSIPSSQERVERLYLLASLVQDQDEGQAKRLIKEAVDDLKGGPEDDDRGLRRKLVDAAFQIDPEFASSLSSVLDKDEGREIARKRIAFNKMKANLREERVADDSDGPSSTDEMDDAAYDLLGSLNANRIGPKSLESCQSLLVRVEGKALRPVFWIFSWTLENLIRKRGSSEEAQSLLRDVFEALLSASEVGSAFMARAAGHPISQVQTTSRSSDSVIVKGGERDRALRYLSDWLGKDASKFLYICDPYFGVSELEALQLVSQVRPELQVTIITSRRKQEADLGKSSVPLDQAYIQYWRRHFSEQKPPESEVIVIGNSSGDLPIHDRWWLSDEAGLRTGTSFNQLGMGKDSEISVLSKDEHSERLREMAAYINREKKEHLGERLTYQAFSL